MGGNGEEVYETCCRERFREVKLGKQRGTFTSGLFSPFPPLISMFILLLLSSPLTWMSSRDMTHIKKEAKNEIV